MEFLFIFGIGIYGWWWWVYKRKQNILDKLNKLDLCVDLLSTQTSQYK